MILLDLQCMLEFIARALLCMIVEPFDLRCRNFPRKNCNGYECAFDEANFVIPESLLKGRSSRDCDELWCL